MLDIVALNERFEHATTEEILRWTWETFAPDVMASSSFQTQSVPLLHIISQVCPKMPVIFIDTGFHFPETLAFRDKLQAQFKLNILTVRPTVTQSELLQQYGEALYRRDPDLCCYINKVQPMQWITTQMKALVAGVRRDQTANRQTMNVLHQPAQGPLQIHPLLNWTKAEVQAYRQVHDLPVHPLYARGYVSVGCAPCTRAVFLGEDERAGRWADSDKKECGLHLDWNEEAKKHGE
jgi:phosphoadenosine phosphosulfate reductase